MNEEQPVTRNIHWRLHLASSPDQVYEMLATDSGRSQFWAETAPQGTSEIHFGFPNGLEFRSVILKQELNRCFQIRYFGSVVTFKLAGDGNGGTDLELIDDGVPAEDFAEVNAGWVSVLMALKAAVDFKIDLRNHDAVRTWDQKYANN